MFSIVRDYSKLMYLFVLFGMVVIGDFRILFV